MPGYCLPRWLPIFDLATTFDGSRSSCFSYPGEPEPLSIKVSAVPNTTRATLNSLTVKLHVHVLANVFRIERYK